MLAIFLKNILKYKKTIIQDMRKTQFVNKMSKKEKMFSTFFNLLIRFGYLPATFISLHSSTLVEFSTSTISDVICVYSLLQKKKMRKLFVSSLIILSAVVVLTVSEPTMYFKNEKNIYEPGSKMKWQTN